MTRRMEAGYVEVGQCPRFMKFLEEIFLGHQDMISGLQRELGRCLSGDVSNETFSFWYGSGANGKSVLANVIANVYGTYCVNAPASMLEVQQNSGAARQDIARLAGARIAFANETGDKAWDSQTIKSIVSTEKTTARFLYGALFEFWPTAKLIVRGNHRPAISDTGDGMWRRLWLWPFDRQIAEGDRDPHLAEKLLEERDGILMWAIEGCRMWRRSGLVMPMRVREASLAYREATDVLAEWVDERCHIDDAAESDSSDLYGSYRLWSESSGHRPLAKRTFTSSLMDRGFRSRKSNGRTRIAGIRLAGLERTP
jgi:putative DNA primase/helicase